MARLLIRISCAATATKPETLPSRSPSSVARASRYASARAPSGTVSTSSWRASINASSSASGPSKSCSRICVTRSARPASNATSGAAPGIGIAPICSAPAAARIAGNNVISWPRRQRAATVRRRSWVPPGSLSARPFRRYSRPPTPVPPNALHGRAFGPILSGSSVHDRRPARSTPRSAARATRPRGGRAVLPSPCRSHGAGLPRVGLHPASRQHEARPSRRVRAAGRRPASHRTAPTGPASATC